MVVQSEVGSCLGAAAVLFKDCPQAGEMGALLAGVYFFLDRVWFSLS